MVDGLCTLGTREKDTSTVAPVPGKVVVNLFIKPSGWQFILVSVLSSWECFDWFLDMVNNSCSPLDWLQMCKDMM